MTLHNTMLSQELNQVLDSLFQVLRRQFAGYQVTQHNMFRSVTLIEHHLKTKIDMHAQINQYYGVFPVLLLNFCYA